MKTITHQKQQEIWDQEHTVPQILLQMDSSAPSSGVIKFWGWLQKKRRGKKQLCGLEIGCGKGRNVIYLAQQGIQMTGFDFSPKAIETARERAKNTGVLNKTNFLVQDATVTWNFPSDTFDFVIDCFATTDIESREGRQLAVKEMERVVKPKGYVLVYVMSVEDQYHKEMIKKSPAREKNAFLHPLTGKFEKVFDKEEVLDLYKGLHLLIEERVSKTASFFGRNYNCYHHWMVFEKI